MMNKSSRKKKVDKFSIIIIPKDNSKVRRYEISRWMIETCIAVALFFVFSSIAGLGGMIHYRNGYVATEQIRLQNAEFNNEKAKLLSQLDALQAAVERTERFASKVEQVAGLDDKKMMKNIGPLAEGDDIKIPSAKLALDSLSGGEAKDTKLDLVTRKMDQMSTMAADVEARLHTVYEFHQDKLFYWSSIPSVWPLRGLLTSDFGPRRSPARGATSFHEGIDISAPVGSTVVATGDGTVVFAGYKGGYGKMLKVDHGFGVVTTYAHNSEIFVKEGQKVKRGMQLCAVGMTGVTTGAHLHYQVEVDGVPVDPMRYIVENI
jgi:murein DD-endopeptidase MepM/ murein hydrolase activator NlpD